MKNGAPSRRYSAWQDHGRVPWAREMLSSISRKTGDNPGYDVAQVGSILFHCACSTFACATKNYPVRFTIDKINNE